MGLTRRELFKVGTGSAAALLLGFDAKPALAQAKELKIARHIKTTRDETFIATDTNGKTVNRCEGIAWNGGCTDTNEFNYLVVKTMRSLGVCYIENQARV